MNPIVFGSQVWPLSGVAAPQVTPQRDREPVPVTDPAGTIRAAIERPHGFEAMRRAFTPDDRVVVAVDDRLPELEKLLPPVLEAIQQAGVSLENVTLLTPAGEQSGRWIDELPDAFQDVRTEVHDPQNQARIAYLASTQNERRLYLNRSLVDADQLVVLARREYDPLFGIAGAESFLFRSFGNPELQEAFTAPKRPKNRNAEALKVPLTAEATEVAWLLGTPFLVQCVLATGGRLSEVVAGLLDSSAEADRRLQANWRVRVAQSVPTVIATVSGEPGTLSFGDIARAAAQASRVVAPGGRVVLLSEVEVHLDETAEKLRGHDSADAALEGLIAARVHPGSAAVQWATAASQAHLYLAAQLHWEVIEDLHATPIQQAGELARLLEDGKPFVVLPDAHRMEVQLG